MNLRRVTTASLAAGLVMAGLIASPIGTSTASASVPTPEEFFGFAMGTEGRLAEFPDIKEYLELIADESAEVDYEVVGTTTEDNEFPIVRMSSPENLERLEEILDINARLADPAQMQEEADAAGRDRDAYATDLAKTSVPVYYIEAGIHSTEVANTQALMDVVYRFAAEDSEFTDSVLENMVVLMVPSQNPDGHDRVVNYFNETAGTDYERVFPDLYQKYVGHDNNRDWFLVTQDESKIRVELEQQYRPAVQHYMHQAGQNSPRIWMPPWDEPMSPTLDPLTVASANSIGQEAQRDLIAEGMTGTKTDDAYGIMWNADVMGYSTFQGTTTWLTEIASLRDLWYTYESDEILTPSESTLRSPLPYDRTTWEPQQAVDYAAASVYSGLETVAENPQEWLYRNMYQVNANSETWDDGPHAYVVPADQRDAYAVFDMMSIFDFGDARIEQATAEFNAGETTYPAGSYILYTDQPLGRWIDQLLREDVYPDEARKCDECPLIMPYSETTDNLGMLFGVEVDAVEESFDAATETVDAIEPELAEFPRRPLRSGAYVLEASSYGLGKVITALEDAGVPAYRATEQITVSGETLAPGALLVPASDRKAHRALSLVSRDTGLSVYALDEVPEVEALKLAETTRVGLVRGANNMPGGWLWWMLEQFGAEVEIVEADHYTDLAGSFDTILLAPGIDGEDITEGLDPESYPEEFHWARGVPDGLTKLQEFVDGGGNLVALGSASTAAASILDLPVENVTPEDRDAFNAPGTLLAHEFSPEVPSTWGMPESWPVWFYNDPAFRISDDSAEVGARYPESDDLLVSGYAHGTDAIAGAANVASFDVGDGSATIAGGHISFRTWPRATWTVITNALYNGAATELDGSELVADMR